MTCNRGLSIDNIATEPAGAKVMIPTRASEFTLRVVDALGTPVAYTVAVAAARPAFHLSAGETFGAAELQLIAELQLTVASPAGSVVELALWYA